MRALPIIALIPRVPPAVARAVVRHHHDSEASLAVDAVELPPGLTTIHLTADPPPVATAAAGDTRAQTRLLLTAMEGRLRRLGLELSDVIRVRVFLAGDTARDGRMDLEGFDEAWRGFFGSARQPGLPLRSVMQVAGLAEPGWLVEIEATAVRPPSDDAAPHKRN
jgi:enamine deaminase RidA (YjgF/YER057c/UK114 family)